MRLVLRLSSFNVSDRDWVEPVNETTLFGLKLNFSVNPCQPDSVIQVVANVLSY